MPDDPVVKSFVAGRSVRDIAKRQRRPLAEVNEIVSRWARTVLHPELREQQLAASLTRLDELERAFYRKALRGDHRALAGCLQIMRRRAVMLGLHAPQRAVLEVIDRQAPRPTSTDKIEAALNALIADRKKDDESTTH